MLCFVCRLVAAAKRLLERGEVTVPSIGSCAYQAFEGNLDFETRYMVDRSIVGCNWIELPAGSYTVRNQNISKSMCSKINRMLG